MEVSLHHPIQKEKQRILLQLNTARLMKTSIKIIALLMAFMAVYSACQFDVVNAVLAVVSLPLLLLGYILISTENETKK